MTGGTGRRAAATILDVAAAAGVSRQTVTRAMNDMPGISIATRAGVLADPPGRGGVVVGRVEPVERRRAIATASPSRR